jgi:glycosyltransferase involved in cell wall biosynthesis
LKRLLLIGWDAYPHFTSGGVYVWQKSLIEGLPDWKFIVFNQLSNPNANAGYKLHKNVEVIGVPIFGTMRYEEFYDNGAPLIPKIIATTDSVIRSEFLPLYTSFLKEVSSENCDLQSLEASMYKIHTFFVSHDYKKCLEHPLTWEIFLDRVRDDQLYRQMQLNEAVVAFRVLQRFLQILSLQLPRVDLVQCSIAWLPSLLALIVKRDCGCPVVVTEHGVAFREVFLHYNAYLKKSSRIFWKTIATNVIKLLYSGADVLVPVSLANAYWQKRLGTPPTKMKLIYNGIDVERFRPMETQRLSDRPTVVSVGRIEPFKDIVCLVQAIKHVKDEIPNVLCLIYGDSITLEYAKMCSNAVKVRQLEDTVKFMGRTSEPERLYNAADVVAVSSVTEGLPLTLMEAMACGKAVVAADVGGVAEALEGCGILVRSRHPYELAQGIVKLLRDQRLRNELGAAGLRKVRSEYSHKKMVSEYATLYETLMTRHKLAEIQPSAVQEVRAQ